MNAPSPVSIIFGGMSVAFGLLYIFFPKDYAFADDRGISKYRFGSRGDAPWRSVRGQGVLSVIIGAVIILLDLGEGGTEDRRLFQWIGAAMVLLGLWGLIAEPQLAKWTQRRKRRQAASFAASPTSAFNEVPLRASKASHRLQSAFFVIFGASCLVLSRTI